MLTVMIRFDIADKLGWEEELDPDDIVNLPRSFRLAAVGRPGCGKTTLVLNIIARQIPPFDKIYVIHLDTSTTEYNILDNGDGSDSFVLTDTIDAISEEDLCPRVKTLIIFDDSNFSDLKKDELKKIDELLRFKCSHRGVSVVICTHDLFSIPVKARAKITKYALWQTSDRDRVTSIARKLGIKASTLHSLMTTYLRQPHDFLFIDCDAQTITLNMERCLMSTFC
jgi:GTPase SAR1 family protein